jgi:hypothetical protein
MAKNSGHSIELDRPEVVIEAIHQGVDQISGRSPRRS